MGKTIGQFDYEIRAPKKGGISFEPEVGIFLTYHTPDKRGRRFLRHSVTEPEIDGYIQALKDDLDHVGRLAKRAMQRASERKRE